MKRLIFLSITILFASVLVNAQAVNENDRSAENPNAPYMKFDKTVHDYGTIYQNSNGTCEFVFKNTGKEPLILSRPKSSCGCTVPTWPKQPILPGKTDVIKVTYATKRVGPINKTVTIYSNASNSPIIIRIKGKVVKQPTEIMPEKDTQDGATPINK